MCTAAIIGGGEARRLGGRPKGLLAFGATSLIERQIALLREITNTLVIVANDRAYASFGVPIVDDVLPGAGALGGIYTALVTATTDQVLVVACDMPFLRAAFLKHVIVAGRSVDIAIPRTTMGYEPLCASYTRGCLPRMREQIDAGTLKIQDLLPHVRVREIGPQETAPYDADGVLFLNVNTPDDYARAVAHLGATRQ